MKIAVLGGLGMQGRAAVLDLAGSAGVETAREQLGKGLVDLGAVQLGAVGERDRCRGPAQERAACRRRLVELQQGVVAGAVGGDRYHRLSRASVYKGTAGSPENGHWDWKSRTAKMG